MRIVSLIPAATEIVYALGLGDELVGRSPADDHPAEVADVPVVAWVDAGDGSAHLPPPSLTGTTQATRPSPHHIDLDALARARPDLILTQRQCQACAVSLDQVERAVRTIGIDPTIVALEASSVEGILNSISTVGAFAEAEDEAVGLIEILRQRLAAVEDRVLERRLAGVAPRRVVILEWLEPPFSSGHWVPEMVRRAGGWDLLGQEGQPSVEVGWERVRDVDPDQVLLAPCGMDALGAVAEWEQATMPVWLDSLRAVQTGELVAVDGGGLLSRPGPRVIDGIAMLAEVFDPAGLAGFAPAGSWLPVGRATGSVGGLR
ncbi:MAG: ABC transporter substrate-binding protein [Chloroflexota bacterium]